MRKGVTRELAEKAIAKLQEAVSYYDEIERLAEEHQAQLKEIHHNERNAKSCVHCDADGPGAKEDYPVVTVELGDIGFVHAGMNLYPAYPDSPAHLSVYAELDSKNQTEVLDEEEIAIHYCPFCGRFLG